MFWRLRAGMGDAIFAPLYEALKGRGVHFKFLHKLSAIEIDDGRVTALQFKTARGMATAADPLSNGSWPEQNRSPLYNDPTKCDKNWQGASVSLVGEQFDAVVFANGIDGFFEAFDESPATRARKIKKLPVIYQRCART